MTLCMETAGMVFVCSNSQFMIVNASTPIRIAKALRVRLSSIRFFSMCSSTVLGTPWNPLGIKTLHLYGTYGKKATRLCHCGYLGSAQKACRCTPDQVARYHSKLSGPLIDRIYLHVEVPAIAPADLMQAAPGESSAAIRARCSAARALAVARQGKANQALQGQEIDTYLLLDDAAAKFLNLAAARLGWSGRSTHRALKVARTIADLAGARSTQVTHVAEAMQYRRALRAGV